MDSLTIATFNVENFSLLLDRAYTRAELEALDEEAYQALNTSIYNPNKDRRKIAAVARTILDGKFDLVGLCEVGGVETLTAFNRIYLDGDYEVFLHEENSKRGIFVGALAKKGRFPGAQASSVPGAFARNLLRLDLGAEGNHLRVFVVHLKSQFGRDWGLEHRLREVDRLATLVRSENCVVMGDFNGILIRGEAQFEYESFLKLPFRDVLDTLGIPENRRRTHYHFGPEPRFTQLDYLFCSSDLRVLEGGVLEGEIPLNRAQRDTLPSDHLPVWARLTHSENEPEGTKTTPPARTPAPRPKKPWNPLRAWLRKKR